MDDTKKTLLSIDLDTSALIKNAQDAKSAISDLINQFNELKKVSTDNASSFSGLNNQLKTTVTDYKNATTELKNYTDALGKKTKAEQDAAKATDDAKKNQTDTKTGTATNNTDSGKKAPATDDASKTPVAAPAAATNSPSSENFFKKEISLVTNFVKQKAKIVNDALEKEGHAVDNFLQEDFKKKQGSVDSEFKILKVRGDAYTKSADIIVGIYDKTTIAGKIAAEAKRDFTLAEIAINTEQAVSAYVTATAAAVQQDMKVPILGPVLAAADIAWGAVEVAGVVAQGVQQAEKVKATTISSPDVSSLPKGKARGGIFESDGLGAYLTGPGNGTSDSINARLSNGESVINARSTQMFAPLLSAINQAGGGVAFNISSTGGAYATGGLFNGSNTLNDSSTDLATTRTTNDMMRTIAANIPRQVLVVEDVQASLQNKVMLQNMSNF